MNRIKNIIDRLPIDNKLIVTVVTYLLTYAITRAGLSLDTEVIPPFTISYWISLGAASAAGYLMPNEATIMRKAESFDGNPDQTLIEQHGLKEA